MKNLHKQAEEIVSTLTLKEKIGQITQLAAGYRCYNLTDDGDIEFTDEFKNAVKEFGGIGAISGVLRADPWTKRYYGTGITLEMREKAINKLQAYIEENTRAKIPAMIEVEASHGLQSLGSVMYPTGLGCAATFNPELYGKMMKEIGKEVEASGNHVAFLTLIDLAGDPRWGRCEETLGEDSYLASRMAESAVKNIKHSNVLACAKHFVGAGTCQGGLNCADVNIGMNKLFVEGMVPAKACVDAGCDMIMIAYNIVDCIPMHFNRHMLIDVLRNELNYEGIIISDGGGIASAAAHLGISKEDGAVMALKSGIELSLADTECFTELEKAVNKGNVDTSYIDKACTHVIEKKLELGLFENRYISDDSAQKFNADKHCEKIAYDVAAESITMVKNNDSILPLKKDTKIVVIGENANDIYHMLGDYTSERLDTEGATLYKAIKSNFENATFVKGWDFNGHNNYDEALEAAAQADVILFSAGGTSKRDFEAKYLDNGALLETENYMDCGEGADLADLNLNENQLNLLRKLKVLSKPIVSVVMMGRAYVLKELCDISDAVLIAYYPGQEGGYAVSDIMTGKLNPSGKLPVSLPVSAGVLPVHHDSETSSCRYSDYQNDFKNTVLYPFGYGISYSEFEYSDLHIKKTSKGLNIEFNVQNTSNTEGKEVVQVYATPLGDCVKHKRHQLKKFSKINLKPNETKKVEFLIAFKDFGFVNPPSPKLELFIGARWYEKFDKTIIELDKNEVSL